PGLCRYCRPRPSAQSGRWPESPARPRCSCARANTTSARASLPAHPEHDHGDEVGEPTDRAEPAVGVAVVTARELDDEGDDDRDDHNEPGDRRRVDVDLAEALVAPVAAQAA